MPKLRLLIPFLFFAGHLLLGLSIYRDYGMGWDEPFERVHALVTARYLIEQTGGEAAQLTEYQLEQYHDRFHGIFFSLGAYGLERLLGLTEYRDIYLLRHLLSFLFFWVGGIVFFFIARWKLGDWRWGLLAWAFLLLSPRIFADSFFNPKDIPLLVLYICATGSLLLFLEKRSLWFAALHALVCGVAISMRITAIIVPALTLGLVVLELLNARFERGLLRAYGWKLLVFLPLLFGFTTLFWPYLWEQPLHRLGLAFAQMSKFNFPSKVLLKGTLMFAKDIPRSYIPYWFFVTTPLLYTGLFIASVVFWARRTVDALSNQGKLYLDGPQRADWVLLALFFAPLASVILFRSVLYDGWRHLFFIYPPFLLFATGGLQSWWRQQGEKLAETGCRCGRRALLIAVGSSMALTLFFMVKYHPHQNVYFNPLTLGDKLTRLDLDYWGLSYKQGFEALAKIDPRDSIRVAVMNDPGRFNYQFLPDTLQKHFVLVEKPEDAEYYLSTFRHWEEGIQAIINKQFPYNGEEVHAIYSEESKILGVYRVVK